MAAPKHKKKEICKKNKGKRGAELKFQFPWAKVKEEFKSGKDQVTHYKDGSRLYQFENGGYLILTPEGVSVLNADIDIIRRYLSGEKSHLAHGGNADIFIITSKEIPLAVKEHKTGGSAVGQMSHMKQIRETLLKQKSIHEVPEYYGVAGMPRGKKPREVSIMQLFSNAKKVLTMKEELEAKAEKDLKSKKQLIKLMGEYKNFENIMKKKGLPLTDFHEGNILTYFNPVRNRYVFIVLDQ